MLFHPTATAASKSSNNITVACSLPENRNGGQVQLRVHGGSTWITPNASVSWSTSQAVDTFNNLAAGTYDVRVLTGDGEYSNILDSAIVVSPSGSSGAPIFFYFNMR
jgi:hypothetical protein